MRQVGEDFFVWLFFVIIRKQGIFCCLLVFGLLLFAYVCVRGDGLFLFFATQSSFQHGVVFLFVVGMKKRSISGPKGQRATMTKSKRSEPSSKKDRGPTEKKKKKKGSGRKGGSAQQREKEVLVVPLTPSDAKGLAEVPESQRPRPRAFSDPELTALTALCFPWAIDKWASTFPFYVERKVALFPEDVSSRGGGGGLLGKRGSSCLSNNDDDDDDAEALAAQEPRANASRLVSSPKLGRAQKQADEVQRRKRVRLMKSSLGKEVQEAIPLVHSLAGNGQSTITKLWLSGETKQRTRYGRVPRKRIRKSVIQTVEQLGLHGTRLEVVPGVAAHGTLVERGQSLSSGGSKERGGQWARDERNVSDALNPYHQNALDRERAHDEKIQQEEESYVLDLTGTRSAFRNLPSPETTSMQELMDQILENGTALLPNSRRRTVPSSKLPVGFVEVVDGRDFRLVGGRVEYDPSYHDNDDDNNSSDSDNDNEAHAGATRASPLPDLRREERTTVESDGSIVTGYQVPPHLRQQCENDFRGVAASVFTNPNDLNVGDVLGSILLGCSVNNRTLRGLVQEKRLADEISGRIQLPEGLDPRLDPGLGPPGFNYAMDLPPSIPSAEVLYRRREQHSRVDEERYLREPLFCEKRCMNGAACIGLSLCNINRPFCLVQYVPPFLRPSSIDPGDVCEIQDPSEVEIISELMGLDEREALRRRAVDQGLNPDCFLGVESRQGFSGALEFPCVLCKRNFAQTARSILASLKSAAPDIEIANWYNVLDVPGEYSSFNAPFMGGSFYEGAPFSHQVGIDLWKFTEGRPIRINGKTVRRLLQSGYAKVELDPRVDF